MRLTGGPPPGGLRAVGAGSTSAGLVLKRERPGGNPVFQNIGAVSAAQANLDSDRIVPGRWTDAKPGTAVCALGSRLSVVASTCHVGAGDGPQPHHNPSRHLRPAAPLRASTAVSHTAIAAALALPDVSVGERLAAYSLASYANGEHLAWPGTRLAAARAGLSKSQYLAAREALQRREVITVQETTGGRGRSSLVAVGFAQRGPWCDSEINAALFEAVLGYSRARGVARLLLATLAALADAHRRVSELSAEEVYATAGISDRSYRRASAELLGDGALTLERVGGGRHLTNCWQLTEPLSSGPRPNGAARPRVPPSPGVRPLINLVGSGDNQRAAGTPEPQTVPSETQQIPESRAVRARGAAVHTGRARTVSLTAHSAAPAAWPECWVWSHTPVKSGWPGEARRSDPDRLDANPGTNPGQDRTLSSPSAAETPVKSGRFGAKPRSGPDRFAANPGQDRTLSAETPAQTPAETPAPNARAGREPQNPRTKDPPNPPEGGRHAPGLFLDESYVTARGRKRPRRVRIDADAISRELAAPSAADQQAWAEARTLIRDRTGETTFDIWLAGVELGAVDADGRLVLTCAEHTAGWVHSRFAALIAQCGDRAGREMRFAMPAERLVLKSRSRSDVGADLRQQPTRNRRAS
jgi:hypothetical protein